jgi:hypothetical protein
MNDLSIFLLGLWVGINVDYLWTLYIKHLSDKDDHGRMDRED